MAHSHLQKDNCSDNPWLEPVPGLPYKNKYHHQQGFHTQAQVKGQSFEITLSLPYRNHIICSINMNGMRVFNSAKHKSKTRIAI